MRPVEFISTQLLTPSNKPISPKSIDETIAKFLTTSARYMNLPAERVSQLIQQKNLN